MVVLTIVMQMKEEDAHYSWKEVYVNLGCDPRYDDEDTW